MNIQKVSTVTVLPQAKVRYSGSVPNLSRRGGIRVHPVRDGGIDMLGHTAHIRTRDRAGNKLRDITDPETGLCIGAVSPLESNPVNCVGAPVREFAGVSGGATGTLKYLPASVRLDQHGMPVYLDENGRRIRTLDMGECAIGPVPVRPTPVTDTQPRKEGRTVSATAPKSARPTPGTRTGTGRITDSDVISFIRAMCKKAGRPVPTKITAQMRADARATLSARIRQAQQVLTEADKLADKKAGL